MPTLPLTSHRYFLTILATEFNSCGLNNPMIFLANYYLLYRHLTFVMQLWYNSGITVVHALHKRSSTAAQLWYNCYTVV